jgi:5-methylcytosine-specific restriction endonuclease McrA
VNTIRRKVVRLRLDPNAYENLRENVLHRDGWRCQACRAMSNLEVHHQQFRSHSGDDSELNLITLCRTCHSQAHRGTRVQPLPTTREPHKRV